MKTQREYFEIGLKGLLQDKNYRDLGKFFAEPNEYFQEDWINENCSFQVEKRNDFNNNADASGYDLISIDNKLRIQSKLRARTIHLEQTRRKSGKNTIAENNTGHVRYKLDELDVVLVSRPNLDEYENMDKWGIIALPTKDIEDPKTPGYCYANVPKKVWSKYIGRAKEVLEEVYESVSNR
tara:strand:+ start:42 stop:584 length:543 start_codon:yes stop_codon:yes gene_type:complete